MKSQFWMMSLGLLIAANPIWAAPFDESKGPEYYNGIYPIDKEVNLPAGISVDDFIVAISKAADVDFLVDATDISKEERVKPFPSNAISKGWKQSPTGVSFWNFLSDVEADKNLTDLRYDENTYLLWSRPSASATANLILAAHAEQPPEALPDEFEVFRKLNDLIKNIPSRNVSPDGASSLWTAKIANVPVSFRSQLKSLAQHQLLRPELSRGLLLSDDYWAKALVRLALKNEKGMQVAIRGMDEYGQPTNFFRLAGAGAEYSFIFPQGNPAKSVYDRPGIINGSWRFNSNIVVPPSTVPVVQPAPNGVPVEMGLSAKQLSEDPDLQSKVSIESKSVPLIKLLSETLGRSGIKVQVKDDVSAKTSLVIASVRHMTLGSFMGAVTRLYGVYWTKQSKTEFVLHNKDESDLDAAIRRFGRGGDPNYIVSQWRTTPQRLEVRLGLEQEVIDSLKNVAADTDGMIAFSKLPEELRSRVIAEVKENTANRLIADYMQSKILITDNLTLLMTRTAYKQPSFPQMQGGNPESEDPFRDTEWLILFALPFDETHLHGTELGAIWLYGPPLPKVIQDAAQALPTN